MTVIPCIWLCRDHPETGGQMRRGWWDQTTLADMLDQKLGRFPHGLEFAHIEAGSIGANPPDGAVVVLPGRFHADPEGVAWVNDQIGRLPWVVLVVSSDEEALFPIHDVEHPAIRFWRMTPRPDREMLTKHNPFYLGEGYGPGTREAIAELGPDLDHYIDVGFIGQVTHSRRTEMMAALNHLIDFTPYDVQATASPGFTQGLDRLEYTRLLMESKIAPCPAGPATPDSFRFFEALEAGCLPVVDRTTPEGWKGYWEMVFGRPDPPILQVGNWGEFQIALPVLLENWQHRANRAGAWWCQVKRGMIQRMANDIGALTELRDPGVSPPLADLITVVMPTSVIPIHPSTEIIEATIASVRERLPDCSIVIACDGVREEQLDRKADYDEYVRRVVWKCQHEWANVVPVVAEKHLHQGLSVKAAMGHVRTPMVLFMEHDTPLVGDIDWWPCVAAIADETAHMIRFHHESQVLPEHEHLMLDREPIHHWFDGHEIDMQRTVQFSARPHLASARWYRDLLDTYFGPTSRAMIEDTVNGIIMGYWHHEGMAGWERHKIWLYTPPTPHEDGGIQRSDHLDGRGDDPMFPQRFEYHDGGPGPEHAPRAMSWRVD